MSSDSTTLLLNDLTWLGSLARQLAADPQLAEDAAQETWLAAQRGPGSGARPRAWFAAVLRNWVRQHARAERTRRERQQRAARPEATEGTAELVQRAEVQRQLVDNVLQLPAIYRDVILLRFFDDEPPRAIARRLDVPIATVHSRLQRALQLLREQLDARSGGRPAWLAALVPALPSAPALLTMELLAMNVKLKVLVAAVVVAGLVPFVWPGREDAASRTERNEPAAPHEASGGGGGGGDAGAALAAAQRRLAPRSAESAPSSAPATFTAAGRVLDERGTPVPRVEVGVRGARPRATSDGTGRFALALPAGDSTIVATEERWVTVLAGTWSPESRYEPVVVVAASQNLGGRVIDENGAPVAGALLAVAAPEGFDARLSLNLDRTQRQQWNTRSGGDGTFRLPRVPRLDGATVFVAADAFRPVTVPLPAAGDENMQIVLARFAYEAGQLTGVVVDPFGAPVENARVAMGVTSVVTDAEGRFGLPLRRAGWPSALVAAKAGYLPARCEVPRDGGTKVDEWPRRLVLQLGQRPLSIRGRVLDQHGGGVAGVLVWVSDPTQLGIVGLLPVQTEYLLAGGAVPPFAARMRVRWADDPKVDEDVTEQNGFARDPDASWYFVTTDAQGDFAVPGLLARDYTLRALDPASGMTADAAPTAAGGTAEIRITREGVWPLVTGRVLSQRGEPIAGVEVQQIVSAFHVDARVPGGRFRGSAIRAGQRTTTGADGSFGLRDIGARHSILYASGDAIMPRSVEAKDITDPVKVVIEVEARCHVEVAIDDPAEADQISARDAHGKGVDLAVLRANSNSFETDLPLHDGKSGVFVLSERATELLLLRAGKVVRRVPLALQPGKLLRVQ